MKSLFIAVEGIDGSGTTTQSHLLKEYFESLGEKSIVTTEPTTGIIGKLLRQLLQNGNNLFEHGYQFDQQMAYLFAADRYYHLYNQEDGIYYHLANGVHVITTRYYFSSLAYNCHNQDDWELVSKLNQNFPNPDLLIYLDLPIEISLARIGDRPAKEIYETREKLTQVRNNYRQILGNYSNLILTVNAEQPIHTVHQTIIDFIVSKQLCQSV
jgi:dTMP kinase